MVVRERNCVRKQLSKLAIHEDFVYVRQVAANWCFAAQP